jgi:hypothetical protein
MEAPMDGDSEAPTRKAIELAKADDMTAIRLFLERILPPRKDRPVTFTLPTITSAGRSVGVIRAPGLPFPPANWRRRKPRKSADWSTAT